MEGDLRALIARLRVAARKSKRTMQSVSLAVGYNRHYLSQLLGGSARLSFTTLFQVTNELGVPPVLLFGDVYDFADLLPAPGSAADRALARPVDVPFQVQRLTDRLYVKVAEVGVSQREICRRLGEHEDFVNQVLTGRIELRVEHVLRILRAIRIDPASFFAEFFGVYGRLARLAQLDEEVFAGITQRDLAAFFQTKTREVRAALEAAAEEEPPPPKGGAGKSRRAAQRSSAPAREGGGHKRKSPAQRLRPKQAEPPPKEKPRRRPKR